MKGTLRFSEERLHNPRNRMSKETSITCIIQNGLKISFTQSSRSHFCLAFSMYSSATKWHINDISLAQQRWLSRKLYVWLRKGCCPHSWVPKLKSLVADQLFTDLIWWPCYLSKNGGQLPCRQCCLDIRIT